MGKDILRKRSINSTRNAKTLSTASLDRRLHDAYVPISWPCAGALRTGVPVHTLIGGASQWAHTSAHV